MKPPLRQDPLARHCRDPKTDCWEWTGRRTRQGYGVCVVEGKKVYAHRLLFAHHVGPVPSGRELHHRCDNKGCVNPAHLEPLTRREHMAHNPHTKLTAEQAGEIRAAMGELCQTYGVQPRTLAAIAEGTIWNG